MRVQSHLDLIMREEQKIESDFFKISARQVNRYQQIFCYEGKIILFLENASNYFSCYLYLKVSIRPPN